jgi:hypothetical protein
MSWWVFEMKKNSKIFPLLTILIFLWLIGSVSGSLSPVASHTWATWYTGHYWQPYQMVMPGGNTTGLSDITKITLTAGSCSAGSGSYSGDLKTAYSVSIGSYSVTWSDGVFEFLTTFTGDTSPGSIGGHVYFDGFSSVAPGCDASGDNWNTGQLGHFNGVSGTGISYTGSDSPAISPPIASFNITLTDTSTNGTPTSWIWNVTNLLGDNIPTTISTSNKTDLSLSPGNYIISLLVSNSAGSSIAQKTIGLDLSSPRVYYWNRSS